VSLPLALDRADVADYLSALFLVYLILIFIRILLSWIPRMPYNPALSAVVNFVHEVTDPYLNIFRRVLPSVGGGGFALDLTIAEPRLAASVINYGHLVTDPAAIAKIGTPILGNFGAQDRGIPPADVRAFDQALKKAGKSSDLKIYAGAGHAFMNPNNKGGYRTTAAEDAWGRIDQFLARALRPS